MSVYKNANHSFFSVCATLWCLAFLSHAHADNSWDTRNTFQGYLQSYSGADERKSTVNAGVYISADYLDFANVSVGYNYTFVDFEGSGELAEHLFYLSGRHSFFLDILPGKLTTRFDVYLGQDTLSYRIGSAPSHRGHRILPSIGSSSVEENGDITVYQPQVTFINYARTFYADIGYARSEYDNETTIKVDQVTPTVGFGWNDSYDWLQLRGYFISVDNADTAYDDDQFGSLEATYTHWFTNKGGPQMEFIRLSALTGERVLAVDPDAAAVYSTADKQTGAITASVQWKLSQSSNVLALASYGQNENNAINDNYDSLLFYINLQQHW
jgi:hypothetical protein